MIDSLGDRGDFDYQAVLRQERAHRLKRSMADHSHLAEHWRDRMAREEMYLHHLRSCDPSAAAALTDAATGGMMCKYSWDDVEALNENSNQILEKFAPLDD